MDTINNINNLTGDELNKMLERLILIPEELRARLQLENEKKYFVDKAKHQDRCKKWRDTNKELYNFMLSNIMKEKYRTNAEFRAKQQQAHRDKYYFKKYGMNEKEYKQKRALEINTYIETNKNKIALLIQNEEGKPLNTETKSTDTTSTEKRKKINGKARHNYYIKKYGMPEEEYKKQKQEEYNNKMEKYKDKFNNIFIPSYVQTN